MGATVKTHLSIFDGQLTQVPAGLSLPASQEDPMYLVGNDDGLDDGDMFYLTNSDTLTFHLGGTWIFLGFTHSA